MKGTRSHRVAIKAGLTASGPYRRAAKRRLQVFSTVNVHRRKREDTDSSNSTPTG